MTEDAEDVLRVIHLQTSIFAMQLMDRVLISAQKKSRLSEEESDRVFQKVRSRWQARMALSGALSIPSVPSEVTQSTVESTSKWLSQSLPPLKRPSGDLHGRPKPVMASVPYIEVKERLLTSKTNNWHRFVASDSSPGHIKQEFVLKSRSLDLSPSTAAPTTESAVTFSSTSAPMSSSSASSSRKERSHNRSTTLQLSSSSSSSSERSAFVTGMPSSVDALSNSEGTGRDPDDLLHGMLIDIDPRFWPSHYTGCAYPQARLVQIFTQQSSSLSTPRQRGPRARRSNEQRDIKLHIDSTGEEFVTQWPHPYLRIFRGDYRSYMPSIPRLSSPAVLADVGFNAGALDVSEVSDSNSWNNVDETLERLLGQIDVDQLDLLLPSDLDGLLMSRLDNQPTQSSAQFDEELRLEGLDESMVRPEVALLRTDVAPTDLVLLQSGLRASQSVVEQVENALTSKKEHKPPLRILKNSDMLAASLHASAAETMDSDSEDPLAPLTDPDVTFIGKLRKMNKPTNGLWEISLEKVYVRNEVDKRDVILPVVTVAIQSSKLFGSSFN